MNQKLDTLRIDKGVPNRSRADNRRVWLVAAIAGVVVFLLVLFFFQRRAVTVETATVTQVHPTQGFTLLNASGYVVARRKAAVAAKTTGRLEWLGVEEGSRVRTGEVVARLENRDLTAALDQTRSAVQTAASVLEQVRVERTDATQYFERQKELLKQGIVAKADFDVAEARYRRSLAGVTGAEASLRSAEATRRGAEVALDYSLIRAPFDAVVLTKNADIGDIITPLGAAANSKAAVVTIADLTSLEVEADVSESSLAQVKTGQPCEVTLDALPGIRFRSVVHTIVPTADRSKASVMVKVRFVDHDERVLPEMSAKVAFLSRAATKEEQQPRIAVNPAAIVGQGKETRVFRIVDGTARAVAVIAGRRSGDLMEVSGIKPGDRLVLKPLDKIRDGSRVKVLEK
jgi:RND family efflux transporter MFP subunit